MKGFISRVWKRDIRNTTWWQNDRHYLVNNSSSRHYHDLNIQLCCLCRCVVGVQTFQRKVVPSARLYAILLGLLDAEDEGTRAFETSRTTYPTTEYHMSAERNNRQDCRGNFSYRKSWLFYIKPRVTFTNITVYMAPFSVFVYLQQLCWAKWVYGESGQRVSATLRWESSASVNYPSVRVVSECQLPFGESRQRVSATFSSRNFRLFIFCLKI